MSKYKEIQNYFNSELANGCELLSTEEELLQQSSDGENIPATKSKLKIKCPKCNEVFQNTFSDFKSRKNKMCYKCHKDVMGEKYQYSLDYVREYLKLNGYTLLSKDYKNGRQKIDLQCPEGHFIKMAFNKFKSTGRRCSFCQGGVSYTLQDVKNKIEIEPGFKLLNTEYKNFLTDLRIQCPEGHIYDTYLSKWDAGVKCPVCSSSVGEKKVYYILTENNIPFKRQYSFKDCQYKGSIPFDFAVFYDKERTKLKALIEYDGEYHYRPINFGGLGAEKSEERLTVVQEKDKIKNEYCTSHNIKLIRIPYWEFNNMEDILISNLLHN